MFLKQISHSGGSIQQPLKQAACAVVLTTASAFAGVTAVPDAQGFGGGATGGRGGDVYHVTTLADDPTHSIPGSLFYGLYEKNVPLAGRTIVFDVGGTIKLGASTLDLKNIKNVTIAGQTAPSPITIVGNTVQITSSSGKETGNIILQHVAIRKGLANSGDALSIKGSGNTNNILVDHVSGSWSEDEVISVGGATNRATNVTVQYSIMSEALTSGHQFGSLVRSNADSSVSYVHNLYSNNTSRNPRPGSYLGSTLQFEFQNNVIYNWSQRAGYTGGEGSAVEPVYMNYQGNYLIAGPNTPNGSASTTAFTKDLGDGHPLDLKVFQAGNKIDSNHNATRDGADTGWGMFAVSDGSAFPDADKRAMPWAYAAAATADSADDAYAKVIGAVGALPWGRVTTDQRLVNEVQTNTGVAAQNAPNAAEWNAMNAAPEVNRAADWDTDKDGMPNYWETARGLNPNSPAVGAGANENNGVAGNGLTNLENYLRFLSLQSTWNTDANTTWNEQLNWRGFRPEVADATAVFGPVTTAARTVTLATAQTVGQVGFNSANAYTLAGAGLTLDVVSGTAEIGVVAGHHTISAPITLADNAVFAVNTAGQSLTVMNVALGGKTLTLAGPGDHRLAGVVSGAGNIVKTGTGTASLTGANTFSGTTILKGGTLKAQAAAAAHLLSNAGGVNLQGGTLILDYAGGSSPAATVRTILSAGYAGNFAAGQIRSTTLPAGLIIGYGDDALGNVTVRVTLPGDANLDGGVDFNDFLAFQNNFGATNVRFDQGDFNYDGATDFNDFLALQNNFGQNLAGGGVAITADQAAAVAAFGLAHVPEPGLVGLVCPTVVALLRRRRA